MDLRVLLVSTYEMGRQPFGLASPAAWLRRAGAKVLTLDLAVDPFCDDEFRSAHLVAFHVPMHTALRLAVAALQRARQVNPHAHYCFFGLYAAIHAPLLSQLGVQSFIAGEFESALVDLAINLDRSNPGRKETPHLGVSSPPTIHLDRLSFITPDRRDLPPLSRYAHLLGDGVGPRTTGYVEASRGCKHMCRHCPIVPVYHGAFRIIPRDIVLADIRQQVAAGAGHITFGDPDFFNGPGHALPLVRALHAEFPHLTYDVTIKVEHLLQEQKHLAVLRETGCLFITSAVESFDPLVLARFDKRHTTADIEQALNACRAAGLLLVPTFVAFTPWTTLANYRQFLTEIVRLDLVDLVSPVQYVIRLLIPPASVLLELPEIQSVLGPLDPEKLCYDWHNPASDVEHLYQDLYQLVRGSSSHLSRRALFSQLWARAHAGLPAPPPPPFPGRVPSPVSVPYLSEPWFC